MCNISENIGYSPFYWNYVKYIEDFLPVHKPGGYKGWRKKKMTRKWGGRAEGGEERGWAKGIRCTCLKVNFEYLKPGTGIG